jgi:hypothetical protein
VLLYFRVYCSLLDIFCNINYSGYQIRKGEKGMNIRVEYLLGLDVVFLEDGDLFEVIDNEEYVNRVKISDLLGKKDCFVIKAPNLEPPL